MKPWSPVSFPSSLLTQALLPAYLKRPLQKIALLPCLLIPPLYSRSNKLPASPPHCLLWTDAATVPRWPCCFLNVTCAFRLKAHAQAVSSAPITLPFPLHRTILLILQGHFQCHFSLEGCFPYIPPPLTPTTSPIQLKTVCFFFNRRLFDLGYPYTTTLS